MEMMVDVDVTIVLDEGWSNSIWKVYNGLFMVQITGSIDGFNLV